jgi:hypothetical protein
MTATERMIAEELVPALGQLLFAIQRVTAALALDAHVEGKLPQPEAKRRKRRRGSSSPRRRSASR